MNKDFTLKKIKVSEIESFLNSTFFKQLEVKPISIPRAQSFINNPRADANDVVIYMLLINNQLCAFRTLLPDHLYSNNKVIKFGWLSGNWVHTDHRRKGFSKKLLEQIYNDWDSKLMFSNYAPESFRLYKDSNLFTPIAKRNGIRFYSNIDIKNFRKSKIVATFSPLLNAMINMAAKLKKTLYKPGKINIKNIRVTKHFTENFINHKDIKNALFKRDNQIFQWIFDFPWLSNSDADKEYAYPFSLYEPNLQYYFVSANDKTDSAFKLIFSERDKNVKILYYFTEKEHQSASDFIMNFCAKNNIKTLTVLDKNLCNEFQFRKNPFIFKKSFKMHIFSSFEINNSDYTIFDGDGDYIFT